MAVTQATQLAEFSSGIGTAGAILEVDNVSNRIGIGTTNPQALLQVGDIIKMDGVTGVITATSFSGNVTGVSTGLTGTPDITVGNIVAAGATFSGVVTYEDVTNVDSLGIVTARTGLEVTANGLVINAGVSTFAADLSIADKIIHTGDTNTAIRFPSGDTFTVETSGTERLRVGSTGTVGVAGLSTATSFGAFNHLSAPFGGGTVSYTVTVATKTANHRYNGSGSSNGYLIDGVEAPFLTLTPGRTYRFVHDNTGSHPLKFYLEADRTTLYSTGVTFDNAYTEIVVSDTTPQVLHYQCTNHAYMGNAVQTNSNIGGGFNVVDESSDTSCNVLFTTDATGTALEAKTGTNLTFNSSTGALTATSFVGALTGAVTGAATQVTVADESSDTTCFPLFATGATGDLAPKSGTNLTFNSSSGALTATSFVGALTGDVTGNATGLSGTPNIDCGTGSFTGDVDIADKIVHTGDTNTAIRFPAADTFTVETGGSERLRVTSAGRVGINENSPDTPLHVKSADNVLATFESTDADSLIEFKDNGTSDTILMGALGGDDLLFRCDAGNILFHTNNNTEKLRITSAGLVRVPDSGKFTAGAGDDLQIYHDGSNNYVDATSGSLFIRGSDLVLEDADGNDYITCSDGGTGGTVTLKHLGSAKLATSSSGVTVTGTLNATTDVTINGVSAATAGKAIAMAFIFG